MKTTYRAFDPRTGTSIRPATPEEIAAYNNNPAPFDTPTMVGSVLIDTYTGPGIWFGGAGF